MNDQDYYHKHHLAYYRKTAALGSAFLRPLEKHLWPGCTILDIGCGSGRDLLWLKKGGFVPIGFERSPGLAALARRHSGCQVIEGDFTIYNFAPLCADAVMMSGSLVHIPPLKILGAINNIQEAFREDPNRQKIVYISLKEGHGSYCDPDGRVFYLWEENDLRQLFEKMGLAILDFSKSLSADGKGKTWMGFVMECCNGRSAGGRLE